MSDYKFKVGDTIRILKMDKYSCKELMSADIGKIGFITYCYNDDGINCYVVSLENSKWLYAEDSLELVESDTRLNRDIVSRKRILELLQYAKKHKDVTIDDLIICVRELPCK